MQEAERKKVAEKLIRLIMIMTWAEIKQNGINIQQALKVRRGEEVVFRDKTLRRLKHLVS